MVQKSQVLRNSIKRRAELIPAGEGSVSREDALVVVDEESRWRRHVRTSLPQFVVAQRGGDSVRRAAVQVKLAIHRRTLTTEVDDSGEPAHDRRVRAVLPVQRGHGVPPGAEMPFHLGTRGFYITFPRFS